MRLKWLGTALLVGAGLVSGVAYAWPGRVLEGRMTGGGNFMCSDVKVTFGYELHCDTEDVPNNFEINWGGGNHAHLDTLTSVECFNDPSISPTPPVAPFDKMYATGTGSYNGVDGATIYVWLTDAGEPGRNDTINVTVVDASGATVLDCPTTALADGGNNQAHKDNK